MRRLLLLTMLLASPCWGVIQAWDTETGIWAGYGLTGTATLNSCATNHAYLVVISIGNYGFTTAGLQISSTNILSANWHAGSVSSSSSAFNTLVWAYSASISNSETVSVAPGSSQTGYGSFVVQCFSGTASSPLDQSNAATGVSNSVITLPSTTPTQNNELVVVGGCDQSNGGTPTVSGMTVSVYYTTSGVVSSLLAISVQTAATTVTPTATWATSGNLGATIMTFEAAPSSWSGYPIIME